MTTIREHELKTDPTYFAALLDGTKTFEAREDDRGFRRGDVLILKEWTLEDGYSGREERREVSYVCDLALLWGSRFDGKVVLGFEEDLQRAEALTEIAGYLKTGVEVLRTANRGLIDVSGRADHWLAKLEKAGAVE